MSKITHDQLWKFIIEDFFEELSIITKKLKPMGIFELVSRAKKEEGLDLARNFFSLHRSGKSAEQIAEELDVPLERVEEIIKYLKA